jgi:transcriptional regulator with XRE-family HTH domain
MISTVLHMTGAWQYVEFGDYLRLLMREAGIKDFAELSRLTSLNQSLFSNWRRGQTRPSHESLRKIAPVLNVAPVKLYMAAGLADADEMDLGRQVDMTVLPAEIRELIDLWPRLSADQEAYARRFLTTITTGLRAELDIPKNKLSTRSRPA